LLAGLVRAVSWPGPAGPGYLSPVEAGRLAQRPVGYGLWGMLRSRLLAGCMVLSRR
jgi:hypothetical protein